MWIAGDTHVGQKRRNNQDVFLSEQLDSKLLMMVCDGMGGEQGGEQASELAIEAAGAMLRRDLKGVTDESTMRRVLECAGAAANRVVFDAAQADSALTGMGTTLVGAVVLPNCAHFIHAGDSRAYLLRNDVLTQLTVDHTVVQVLIDRGEISQDDAKNHPQRHYITRAVGVSPQISYDIFSLDLLPNDTILLCSDGLYNYMSHEDICALTAIAVKRKSVAPLIDRANENGGGDNITAVVCCVAGEVGARG